MYKNHFVWIEIIRTSEWKSTMNLGVKFLYSNEANEGIAKVYSDDADDASLDIFMGGNGDWYLGCRDPRHPRVAIRCCTSGTMQPSWFGFIVAALWHAVKGNKKAAVSLLRGAISSLEEKD